MYFDNAYIDKLDDILNKYKHITEKKKKKPLYIKESMHIIFNKETNKEYSIFNPIQDGGKTPSPPTSFYPVTSTNVNIGPQNFQTFSFNSFATLV